METARASGTKKEHLLASDEDNKSAKLESGESFLKTAQKPVSTRTENNQLDLWLNKKRSNNLFGGTQIQGDQLVGYQAKLAKIVEAKTKQPIVLRSGLINIESMKYQPEFAIKEEQSTP